MNWYSECLGKNMNNLTCKKYRIVTTYRSFLTNFFDLLEREKIELKVLIWTSCYITSIQIHSYIRPYIQCCILYFFDFVYQYRNQILKLFLNSVARKDLKRKFSGSVTEVLDPPTLSLQSIAVCIGYLCSLRRNNGGGVNVKHHAAALEQELLLFLPQLGAWEG